MMTKKGDRVVCFNQKCKGKDDNHYIHSCPRANEKERKEIMATMHKTWAENKQAKKVVPGQSHAQISEGDIERQVFYRW